MEIFDDRNIQQQQKSHKLFQDDLDALIFPIGSTNKELTKTIYDFLTGSGGNNVVD